MVTSRYWGIHLEQTPYITRGLFPGKRSCTAYRALRRTHLGRLPLDGIIVRMVMEHITQPRHQAD